MTKTETYKIIVPLYNEQKYIRKFIEAVPEKHLPHLILVNDGSTDKTKKILQEEFPKLTLINHTINLGKGKSLETGAMRAIKEKADIIICMDGDLQHKPEDLDRFLRKFKKDKKLEILFGARKIGTHMSFMPFFGNKLLTITINLLYRYFLNDTQCGFRAFRSKIYNKLKWESPGYEAETEMIINAAKHKLKYKEINIDTVYLDDYKGTNMIDGIIVMSKTLLWKLFKRN
ncbi:glycosyltransferase family 2 protein [Candidatus Peregrinibacteria bacterium]|jgi:glycosyltransferase involved in cell wall biosynthesis|nr:glycosyltransferase family 2 protein [Candidatus Peregrinibacteria bacterium]MBT4055837.1 glycosyltransferase family 2 protein [Candidatus Peregrinibacteria bacterium]